MRCHEVSLAGGRFQIAVEERPDAPRFTASVRALDPARGDLTPVVLPNGQPAEVHATSEALALRSAVAWLEEAFGRSAVRVR